MLAWRRGFYGYVIVACSFVIYMLIAENMYIVGVLSPIMAMEFGWSATEFGAAVSIFVLAMAIGFFVAGLFVNRFGPRLAVITGSLVLTSVGMLCSFVSSLLMFYALVFVYGMATSLGGTIATMQLVNNWFFRRRGIFLGIVISGAGFGGLLIVPIVGNIATNLGGWRVAWQLVGLLALIPTILGVLFLRNTPVELGQRVDDAGTADNTNSSSSKKQASRVHKTSHNWDLATAVRTPTLWLVTAAWGGFVFGVGVVTSAQVVYLSGEVGMDVTTAATALGLMVGFGILGRLIGGWSSDKVEPRVMMSAFLLLQAFSLVLLLTWHTASAVYVYVALFGISYAANLVLVPALIVNYYGIKNFASINGSASMVAHALSATGPMIAGVLKDTTGSYSSAFLLVISIAIVGALCAFISRPPLATSPRLASDR